MEQVEVENFLEGNSKNSSLKYSRWYKGEGINDAFKIIRIVQRLAELSPDDVDAEHLFLGTRTGTETTERNLKRILQKVNRNYDELRFLTDYLRDHELGLEGILMRQSTRLLEELRAEKLTQSPAILRRGDEEAEGEFDEPFLAGYLQDRQIEKIEECSTHTRLAVLNLNHEIELKTKSGRVQKRAGRFFNVTRKNIVNGNKCDFLLSGTRQQWEPVIENYLTALQTEGHVHHSYFENLSFRVTSLPLGAGFILMDLDLGKLHAFLRGELQKDYLPEGGQRLGLLASASDKTHGGGLMDPDRTKIASAAWDHYISSDCTVRIH